MLVGKRVGPQRGNEVQFTGIDVGPRARIEMPDCGWGCRPPVWAHLHELFASGTLRKHVWRTQRHTWRRLAVVREIADLLTPVEPRVNAHSEVRIQAHILSTLASEIR